MEIEFRKMPIIKRWATRAGSYELEQDSGFERVIVDGDQVGLVPNDEKSEYYRILHPLSKGFPVEFLHLVVANSGGRLTGTLNGPVPMDEEEEEIYDDDDDESEG